MLNCQFRRAETVFFSQGKQFLKVKLAYLDLGTLIINMDEIFHFRVFMSVTVSHSQGKDGRGRNPSLLLARQVENVNFRSKYYQFVSNHFYPVVLD